jgi:hypothetical protein
MRGSQLYFLGKVELTPTQYLTCHPILGRKKARYLKDEGPSEAEMLVGRYPLELYGLRAHHTTARDSDALRST